MTTAGLSSLLPLAVAVPLAGAAVAPLVARWSGRLTVITSITSLVASTAILVALAPSVYRGRQLTHYMGHWVPVGGAALGVAFSADAWGLTFALVASGIGVVLLLFTLSEETDLGPRELGSFSCLFLLLDAALIGVALTGDVLNLFVWFEVAALASHALTAFFVERPFALEAAFKILVLTNIASFAVFLGASLLYANHGGLNFGQLGAAVAPQPQTVDLMALALLVAGFATKAGLVPFHGWLPDAHTAAPGPVSALFSGLMVNLGIVAIGRLVLPGVPPRSGGTGPRAAHGVGAGVGRGRSPVRPLPGRPEAPVGLRHHLPDGGAGGRPGHRHRLGSGGRLLPPGEPGAVQVPPVPVRGRHRACHRRHPAVGDGGTGPPLPRPGLGLRGGGVRHIRDPTAERVRIGRVDPRRAAGDGPAVAPRDHDGGADLDHRGAGPGHMAGLLRARTCACARTAGCPCGCGCARTAGCPCGCGCGCSPGLARRRDRRHTGHGPSAPEARGWSSPWSP